MPADENEHGQPALIPIIVNLFPAVRSASSSLGENPLNATAGLLLRDHKRAAAFHHREYRVVNFTNLRGQNDNDPGIEDISHRYSSN